MASRVDPRAALTVVEADDSAGVSGLSQRLPKNSRHRYRLRDPAAAETCTGPLCRHVLRAAGDLQVSWVEERFGTQVEIVEPGIAAHCFSMIHSGQMALSLPSVREGARGGPARGVIHQGEGGTAGLTADGTARTNLWVSTTRIEQALAACLGDAAREKVVFRPEIDWSSEAGSSLRRLLAHAAAEFARNDGLAVQKLALNAFADLFIHTALNGLPHNHSERLLRATADTAPRHLKRAEAFMHAEARQPIQLADIAAAAGCSVRSLQNAFRAFRETTPHAALQRIRLELAQADLVRGDAPIAAVAARYGFSNAGRFATLYAQRFGERPRMHRGLD